MSESGSSEDNLYDSRSKWSELNQLRKEIEREYLNLYKNRTRARSLEGIKAKRKSIQSALDRFVEIVESYEESLPDRQWNRLTDTLDGLRSKVRKSLLILDQSEVRPERTRRATETGIYTEIIFPRNYFDRETSLIPPNFFEEDLPHSSTRIDNQEQNSDLSESSTSFRDLLNEIIREFTENSEHADSHGF